ncbi:MAG: hypothetical protein H6Q64_938 [Firmicutes bacterium]|nr:hypothetical protein [Bacillota bacterium]
MSIDDNKFSDLRADCEKCFGLCCVALYFSASEGFPNDKEAGQPCLNLLPDYRCCVHDSLTERGLKGCRAFDCFGAGQKVARVSFGGNDWREVPQSAPQMFAVFLIMMQLHEMLWYLTEALTLQSARPIYDEIRSRLDEMEQLTQLSHDWLEKLDVATEREKINPLLQQGSELVRADARLGKKTRSGRSRIRPYADLVAADLRKTDLIGANLRGACLIAADLRGADLSGTDFIGADLRDADLRGADLGRSFFLTQNQINSAKGDLSTKLPPFIERPPHWSFD